MPGRDLPREEPVGGHRNVGFFRPGIVLCTRDLCGSMSVDWIGYGYAALVASGGIAGYVKAGSVPSLAAGLLCGGLAGLGAYQQSTDPKNIWLSLSASGTLTVLMGMRYYNSRKFMPAGLIAGASLLMVGKLGLQMLEKPL
ncbi:transmembrane protein 14C-like [Crotalus tigris]|nr:transmembrane protein 14C-like [Crotalus tigris]